MFYNRRFGHWGIQPELFYNYLGNYKKYITYENEKKISPKGWEYLDSLKNKNTSSIICFIAMKFDDRLMNFSDNWVESAVSESGYKPIRINKVQHNNLIDDEIITAIRQSKFIIADLTGNSFGVYFESGYARGFGLETIYICEKGFFEKEKIHFDINHYPFLLWEEGKGEEFKKDLQFRIEATLGKGSYHQ